MEFLSKTYQSAKLAVAASGSVMSCTLLGLGISAGDPVSITAGSVWLASSLFNLGDSTTASRRLREAVTDLKNLSDTLEKEAASFKLENDNLRGTVSDLEDTASSIVSENRKLLSVINQGREQINRLYDLQKKYAAVMGDAEDASRVNSRVAQDLSEENAVLRLSIEQLETSLGSLEGLRAQYKEQNDELVRANEAYSDRVDALQAQLDRIEKLYSSSKQILKLLIESSDAANEDIANTAKELEDLRCKYEETLDSMASLEDGLRESTFQQLDADNDGMVTESEFKEWAKRASGRHD